MVLLSGCAATPKSLTPAHLDRIPVHQISTDHLAGSAVQLGEDRLFTCRHLLTQPVVEINGERSGYRVVAEPPRGEAYVDDWAVIELDDVALPSAAAFSEPEPRPRVKAGQDIYLIGYRVTGDLKRDEVLGLPRTVVKGRVTTLPFYLVGPRRELIYVEAPQEDTYSGLSGGAAVCYDPQEDRLKIVGIYQGTIEYTFLGRRWWKRHVVRRYPALEVESRKSSFEN